MRIIETVVSLAQYALRTFVGGIALEPAAEFVNRLASSSVVYVGIEKDADGEVVWDGTAVPKPLSFFRAGQRGRLLLTPSGLAVACGMGRVPCVGDLIAIAAAAGGRIDDGGRFVTGAYDAARERVKADRSATRDAYREINKAANAHEMCDSAAPVMVAAPKLGAWKIAQAGAQVEATGATSL